MTNNTNGFFLLSFVVLAEVVHVVSVVTVLRDPLVDADDGFLEHGQKILLLASGLMVRQI